jgi:hypothetical protein
MEKVENFLPEGESLIFRTKLHAFVIVKPVFWLIIWLVVLSQTLFDKSFKQNIYGLLQLRPDGDDIGQISLVINIAGWLIIVIALYKIIVAVLRYFSSDILITSRRVIDNFGIFDKVSNDYWLNNIEGINVSQPFWGRVFGYGTIRLNVRESASALFTKISSPLAFRKVCQQEVDKVC